jgi:hypothetical protein
MRMFFWAIRFLALSLLVPMAFAACTITISPATITVAAGGTMSFTATPSHGCSGTYSWTSTIGTFNPSNAATTTFTAQSTPTTGTITVTLTNGTLHVSGNATVTINPTIQAGLFGMDINQNNTVGGVPSGESDPWPSVGGGISFGTYRTLGSAINWSNLVPSSGCPSVEGGAPTYIWSGSNATNNRLYKWFSQAFAGGQKVMFDAYSTPTCTAFNVPFNPSQPCANSLGQDGCYLPGDVSGTDITWKGFINDLLNYLNTTKFSDGKTLMISQLGYIEVWNEPNIGTECDGTDHIYGVVNGVQTYGTGNCTAANLAAMLSDAYQIVQTFNSTNGTNIKVISPALTATTEPLSTNCIATAPTINSFFTTVMDAIASSATGTRSMDYIGFHGYNYIPNNTTGSPDPASGASCISPLIANVQQSATNANSGFTQPLYDTEGSWGGGSTGGQDSLITQSAYNGGAGREQAFAGIFNLVQAAYGPSLQGLNWFGWDFQVPNTGAPSTGQYWDEAGSGSLAPAGTAYATLYSWLSGGDLLTTFAARVAACGPYQSTTVWTCQFVFPNGKFGVVVWDNNGTCSGSTCAVTNSSWTVPATPAGGSVTYSTWYDLDNGTHTISGGTVPISLQPILIND